MTIEEILNSCPELSKVTFRDYINILGSKFNPNKTWKEMGFDELDAIELIMELEKRLDFAFPDILYDFVYGPDIKPINFTEILRDRKLKDLGI